ncbi:MAG: GFA family protein [Alcaligenaceae bacterium]|nr:MAG: GFA family protein [Alcaligenaceae bacterium]
MIDRVATCVCGQLQLTCKGEPEFVGMCHCHQCQTRSGSVFAVNCTFSDDQVKPSGESTTFMRTAESGRTVTYHFCPACGTTVYWKGEMRPQETAVAVGAFRDSSIRAPERAVWAQTRHTWVHEPSGISVYPKGHKYGHETIAPDLVEHLKLNESKNSHD